MFVNIYIQSKTHSGRILKNAKMPKIAFFGLDKLQFYLRTYDAFEACVKTRLRLCGRINSLV